VQFNQRANLDGLGAELNPKGAIKMGPFEFFQSKKSTLFAFSLLIREQKNIFF